MGRIVLGVVIGLIALAVFIWFGGARYVKSFGARTEEAAGTIERVEKGMKETAKGAGKSVEQGVGKAKDKLKEIVK